MKPISDQIINLRLSLYEDIYNIDSVILDRLEVVVEQTLASCGWSWDRWFTDYSPDTDKVDIDKVLDMTHIINTSHITFTELCDDLDTGAISNIVVNGKVYDIFKKLPRRWLFEDFEVQLQDAVKLGKAVAESNSRLRNSALTKLTAKEIKALNIPGEYSEITEGNY